MFDIGETLVDETRQWAAWADWLDIPHLTFFAVLGAAIERGEHHHRVFELPEALARLNHGGTEDTENIH